MENTKLNLLRKKSCKVILATFILLGSFVAKAQSDDSIRAEVRSYRDAAYVNDWQNKIGARTQPVSTKKFIVKARPDGIRPCTSAIQSAIDSCSAVGGGVVEFMPGEYVTGALFLKNDVELHISKGVILYGELNDEAFPKIFTRVAGVEMEWRAALINIRNQHNVCVSGEGTVNARGSRWHGKFWTAEPEYYKKGLRWVVDYDIVRPILMQVYESSDITVNGITLIESPFWTIHVVFSKNVTIDGVTIRNNTSGKGPSTDGINVDSSVFCLVQNCDVDCNDDCYSFKAGMNADGLRVNIPVQYSIFRNNIARRGSGVITLGSDMSGGIQHVEAYNFTGIGTREGIRLKSSPIRGGLVKDVNIHHVNMENVSYPLMIQLNWFPKFSIPELSEDQRNVSAVWKIIAAKTPEDKALPHWQDITVSDVKATGAETGLYVEGIEKAPMLRFHFKNIDVECKTAGQIKSAKDWTFENVHIKANDGKAFILKDIVNVPIEKINSSKGK